MEAFLTADTHFGHASILRHAYRPWSCVGEMDEALEEAWNGTVPRNGRVWIVGDFAWRNHARYLHRLNGKKILIKGNHDRMSTDALRLFSEVHEGGVTVNFGNHVQLFCSHFCPRVWDRSHYGIGAAFGHSHGRLSTFNMSVDVGVDSRELTDEYRPVHVDEVMSWMRLREQEMEAAGRVGSKGIGGQKLYRQDDVAWALKQEEGRYGI
jgi:calcineurin-like phosphoesterase family protein